MSTTAITKYRKAIVNTSAITITSVRNSVVAGMPLEHWKNAAAPNETRHVEILHDTISVVWYRELASSTMSPTAPDCLKDIPQSQVLGTTAVVLAYKTDDHDPRQIAETLLPDETSVFGGDWQDGLLLFCGENDDCLLCVVSDTGDEQTAEDLICGPLRLQETFRHKLLGQHAAYTSDYRESLLEGGEQLTGLLTRVDAWSTTAQPETMLTTGQQVLQKFCGLAAVHSKVKEVEALLTANRKNLEASFVRFVTDASPTQGKRLLRQRATRLHMLLDQVTADLGRVEPVMEAARCVGQFQHSQLLAQLASTEAEENRQRGTDTRRREVHNFRIMLLGLWLGISDLWLTWMTLQLPAQRPAGARLLFWCLMPTLVMTVAVFTAWLARRTIRKLNR